MVDTKYFKKKLEVELESLENELRSIGRTNPDNPADWEATPEKTDIASPADKFETAENITEFEENTAVLKQLEIRYNEVKAALEMIENGTYGICSVGGEEIEKDRLLANPSATTCKAHMGNSNPEN